MKFNRKSWGFIDRFYSNRLSSKPNEKLIYFLVGLVLIIFLRRIYSTRLFFERKWSKEYFVLTLAGEDDRLPKILQLFKQYGGIDLKPFYGFNGNKDLSKMNETKIRSRLTLGQQGLRETMKRFFQMSLQMNYDEVVIFQDDAIPHLNFSYFYLNLPQRCLDADLLLLGASIWHRREKKWFSQSCFDADKSTYGAYALQVKRQTFQPILNWLNDVQQITFDHIYKYLQIDNLSVRVAYPPFLVIMDVSHESLINNHRGSLQFDIQTRAKIHHWNLSEYPITSMDQYQT